MLVELPHPVRVRVRVGGVHVEVVDPQAPRESPRPRSALAVAKRVFTTLRPLRYSGSGSSEIGRPGGHPPSGERRDQRPVLAAADHRLHLHDRASRACSREARRMPAAGRASSTTSSGSPGPARRLPMSCAFQVSTTVVGRPIARMTTASDRRHARAASSAKRPCEQDRDRDEQDLAGAESDPGRF